MSEPDVVAELGRWVDDIRRMSGPSVDADMLQRAQNEIVALRAVLDIQKRLPDKIAANVRIEALEEAARLCERVPGDPKYGDFFAKAIRTLKEKRDG